MWVGRGNSINEIKNRQHKSAQMIDTPFFISTLYIHTKGFCSLDGTKEKKCRTMKKVQRKRLTQFSAQSSHSKFLFLQQFTDLENLFFE